MKRMKKDSLHSVISQYGVVTLAKKEPSLTVDEIPKYIEWGWVVQIRCSKCNCIYALSKGVCPCCDKSTML